MITLGPKDPDERLTLSVGFSKRLDGRTILSATSNCTVLTGTDPAAIQFLDDIPDASSGTRVVQRIKGGVPGCEYLVKLEATLSDGDILVGAVKVPVVIGA